MFKICFDNTVYMYAHFNMVIIFYTILVIEQKDKISDAPSPSSTTILDQFLRCSCLVFAQPHNTVFNITEQFSIYGIHHYHHQ